MTSEELARQIVDASMYMTLATADEEGRPWASPVWYAPATYTELLWVSKPEARHSRNLAARPQLGIVIFDSTVPMGAAKAVYLDATAEELTDPDLERTIAIFSRRSLELGGHEWTADDVRPSAGHRLYRATSSAQFVLDANDERIPVDLS